LPPTTWNYSKSRNSIKLPIKQPVVIIKSEKELPSQKSGTMEKWNKLDKSFGPAGSFAGIILFAVGIAVTCVHIGGLFLVIIGAFVGFTGSYAVIDFDKRRVKLSNNLFGVIKTGEWINVEQGMKIGIKESNRVWQANSWTNRTVDLVKHSFVLSLYSASNQLIIPIQKVNSLDLAKQEQKILCDKLGVETL